MLPKTVSNIISKSYQIINISKRKSNYFVYPTKNDFKNFEANKVSIKDGKLNLKAKDFPIFYRKLINQKKM